jgi:hypothetical protein
VSLALAEERANWARFVPGTRRGHYESYFQRGNHPSRPLAFWIRYTLFSPRHTPEAGIGELWAIYFDGETGEHVAHKREVPIGGASFSREALSVRIADAELGGLDTRSGSLRGSIDASRGGQHGIAWDLRYRTDQRPLFLFPLALYEAPLPKAKSLVGAPLAVYEGAIEVGGRSIDVGGWVGSQNHNWGEKHTDRYAWGQVAGFDDHPGTFLEIGTARLKLGPVWTPDMTPIVLRHEGREHALTSPVRIVRARGSFDYFDWHFSSEDDRVRVEGRIFADRGDFVGLTYMNPPGGTKHCLNTKIASCDLTISYKSGARAGEVDRLSARRRAAFEILTDDRDHGVPIQV